MVKVVDNVLCKQQPLPGYSFMLLVPEVNVRGLCIDVERSSRNALVTSTLGWHQPPMAWSSWRLSVDLTIATVPLPYIMIDIYWY